MQVADNYFVNFASLVIPSWVIFSTLWAYRAYIRHFARNEPQWYGETNKWSPGLCVLAVVMW